VSVGSHEVGMIDASMTRKFYANTTAIRIDYRSLIIGTPHAASTAHMVSRIGAL